MIIKTDCIYFKGDVPCIPNKINGYHCECPEYKMIQINILIIKLGAIGDVIRTTPLLRKIREIYPSAFITWLTYSPEILSHEWVNRILNGTVENLEYIKNVEFDWVINLDKDPIAISLTKSITASKKSGFEMDNFGHAKPISSNAEYNKWVTGLFDDINKSNTLNYMEEIFEIAGYNFSGEEYILENNDNNINWSIDNSKKVVGLNTGCGGRWTSRLWPEDNWIELGNKLLLDGYEVILLGGEQEHEKNLRISKQSGVKYFGHFPLKTFINLINSCNIIVTAVTMAMHIAIGLKKDLVLFNNIFNKNEFYLYKRGEIIEPDFECDCYYTPVCPNNCMQYIYPDNVLKVIRKY